MCAATRERGATLKKTVNDPFYGCNIDSTHVRVDEPGLAAFYALESLLVS